MRRWGDRLEIIWLILIVVAAIVSIEKIGWSAERPIQPTITFSFPEERISEVDHFELHWIPVPGSGVIEYICTLDEPMSREWETPAFDMEIGAVRPFYLVAVMSDGRKGWSMYHNFRYTGKPFVIEVMKEESL